MKNEHVHVVLCIITLPITIAIFLFWFSIKKAEQIMEYHEGNEE